MLMKKIFALLLAALSVALVACGDENTETRNDWFLTPEASADGTTVELTCLTRFGDGCWRDSMRDSPARRCPERRAANSLTTRMSRSTATACRPV